ncbi:carboxypeptidase-like regulatory domain-containing protein [Aeoliella mucimassa]|uniref:Nickel uptake substrate-specific transmembrane region n=1 Tax=Aeoliella mucimassa TaxID=2527972 RepID=A0A518ARR1_9BACT|nr:carboxypeptidase-like regulatory domain-containing protein [Aeoliella mucimassa]QDU57415.1 hypothetical protein Pan181_36310 [Aeoliella mucimassa]
MKLITLQRLAAAIACMGMIVPSAALAAEPQVQPVQQVQKAPVSLDVALDAQGNFKGQLVDAQGVAQKGVEVAMLYNGREVTRSVTDEQGKFAAPVLRGGQYEVVAQGQVASYRVWNAGQAPPMARPAALMITNADVVNGQFGTLGYGGGVLNWMQAHPLIVAGAVVTAIAVPVAITASDDDSSS